MIEGGLIVSPVRYRIVQVLPDAVRDPQFTDLADDQVRLRLSMEGDYLCVIATGTNVEACEKLLISLGAEEIGVELCG